MGPWFKSKMPQRASFLGAFFLHLQYFAFFCKISLMYSDTHLHFQKLTEDNCERGSEILSDVAEYKPLFIMDIGTRSDDLEERLLHMASSIDGIENAEKRARSQKFMYFSAGIWPDVDEINNRFSAMETLEEQLENAMQKGERFAKKIVAIGECGLDHHWNPSNPDGRNEDDFDAELFEGERELFEMQLELAKKMSLPVVIHSRDAFADTIDCIKNIGYNNGIIHCFSYGIEEARAFVNLGWHLAFGGGTTYTKKSKMSEMEALLRYVPDDRLLLETDAPYLSPVPLRGTPNIPQNIRYTYEFISAKRNLSVQQLVRLVDKNCERLFKL